MRQEAAGAAICNHFLSFFLLMFNLVRTSSSSDSPRARPAASPALRPGRRPRLPMRSEEHTSELQSRGHLVCRLLLEKKNTKQVCRKATTLAARTTEAKTHE